MDKPMATFQADSAGKWICPQHARSQIKAMGGSGATAI
jgi:hypothetical protein